MKNIILFFTVCLLFIGCEIEKTESSNPNRKLPEIHDGDSEESPIEENQTQDQTLFTEDLEHESPEFKTDEIVFIKERPSFDLMLSKYNVENIREYSLEFLKRLEMNFQTRLFFQGSEGFLKIPQCSLSFMPRYFYLDFYIKEVSLNEIDYISFNQELTQVLQEIKEIQEAFDGDFQDMDMVCGELIHTRNENMEIESKLKAINITTFVRKAISHYEFLKEYFGD